MENNESREDVAELIARIKKSMEAVGLLIEGGHAEAAKKLALEINGDLKKLSRKLGNQDEPAGNQADEWAGESFAIREFLLKIAARFQSMDRKVLVRNVGAAIIVFVFIKMGWYQFYQKNHGLIGEYFGSKDLSGNSKVRQDGTIDFNWGMQNPMRNLTKDRFSVRWTGYLVVPISSDYKITTISDDGVRVWIGDDLVIQNWTVHGATQDSATLALPAGPVKIKIEYFDNGGEATMKLLWKSKMDAKSKIISSKYLIPFEKPL